MNLKDLREKAGVTQFQVCVALGISIATLCRWEKGGAKIPADVVTPLSRLYKTTDRQILDSIEALKAQTPSVKEAI
jgi:transcriptional regulator with XRE-family HTH domain